MENEHIGFKLTRTEEDAENRIFLATANGSIELRGTSEFVTKIFQEMCAGTELTAFIQESLKNVTPEALIAEMSRAGFPDDVVQRFEASTRESRVNLLVEEFNRRFPVDSTVRWRSVGKDGVPYDEYTVHHAARNQNGQAVCWFYERSSMVSIEPEFVNYDINEK